MSWKRRDSKGRPAVLWAMVCDVCGRESPFSPNKADAAPGWADYFVERMKDVSQCHYCPTCEPRVTGILESLKPKEGAQA